ncbi:MAG: response regulator [Planctomycetes bacterium]|nr:response regulator [Planctomycetota bacterium]
MNKSTGVGRLVPVAGLVARGQPQVETLRQFLRELRMPLAAAEGFAELLRDTVLDDTQQQAVASLLDNCKHLSELVADYAEFAQLETDGGSVQRRLLDPMRLVDECVAVLAGRCAEAGVEIRVRYGSFMPDKAMIDPVCASKALLAALRCALHRADRSVIELGVAYRFQRADAANASLRFSVHVPGRGLSQHEQEYVFAPFAQLGAGGRASLGLAVARRCCELLDGELRVESDGQHSCTFHLVLAASALAEVRWIDPGGVAVTAPETLAIGGRVLLVDDGVDNRILLARVLAKAGAVVEVAARGDLAVQQTLAAAKASVPFDLVLMDIQMPMLDGRQAAKILRREGYRGAILAISAACSERDEQAALAAGCDAFLAKPVERRELVGKIIELIAAARAAVANEVTTTRGTPPG